MAQTDSKALKAREKTELTTSAEQTKPGLIFTPLVDIFETESEIALIADIPGVKGKDLTIDLRENVLTITGEIESNENAREMELLREYQTGKYFREFKVSEVIEQDKIEADLKDGVLRLRLPKVEKAMPRRISVKGS